MRNVISTVFVAALLVLGFAAPAQAGTYPVGQVANSATSSASVRAYDGRVNSNRVAVGLCSSSYKNVAPAHDSGFNWDADCIRMYSGSTKVTGIVTVKSRLTGSTVYTINIGCSTNRYDVAVHGMETGIVSYARKCV